MTRAEPGIPSRNSHLRARGPVLGTVGSTPSGQSRCGLGCLSTSSTADCWLRYGRWLDRAAHHPRTQAEDQRDRQDVVVPEQGGVSGSEELVNHPQELLRVGKDERVVRAVDNDELRTSD